MKLSIRKTLVHDYPAVLALSAIAGLWLVPIWDAVDRRAAAQDSGLLPFLFATTVPLVAVVLWRLHRASRLFRVGCVAAASITSVQVSRRGPITFCFAFEHEGEHIRARMRVADWKFVRWKRVPAFKRGQSVEALYDPARPSRAIILQLFQS